MFKTQDKIQTSKGITHPRHIVELDAKGNPTDKCLCGYLWDRVHVQHNGSICQECVDEMRKRG